MKTYYLASLISLFVFIIPIHSYSAPYSKGQKKARVIVVCDASNSTTLLSSNSDKKGRLDKLKYYVNKIPKWEVYPFGSEIYYYPVSGNMISEPLGRCKICYNITRRSELESEKERVETLTNNVSQEIDVLARNTPNSCILLSICRSINRFYELKRDNPGEDCQNELVIISDMEENCKLSATTNICMTSNDTKKLSDAIGKFEKVDLKLAVSDLNLKVRVIVNTPWIGKDYDLIRAAWENWFYKIGVRKENLFIYTDEPGIHENPLLIKR